MPTVSGRAEVKRYMAQIPQAMREKVLRGAGKAAAKVVADEAKARSISEEVSEAIVIRSKLDGDRIVVRITVKGAWPISVGTWLEWGGQYQNLQAAKSRLLLVVPIAFAVILGLLYLGLGGLVPALAVFSAIPLAIAGGVFALALRGIPFSISAAVGFIALSGVAVLNGLVMMSSIRRRLNDGLSADEAIAGGAIERLRPVLSTALVASLGFVPMALATGTGAEVQKPLATVVIGGLITATALTLFVLPAISKLIYGWRGRTS